jgi:hypothetical protein
VKKDAKESLFGIEIKGNGFGNEFPSDIIKKVKENIDFYLITFYC